MLPFLLSIVFLHLGSVNSLDCYPIPDKLIYPGDEFWYPNNSPDYVLIPPNFNCTYVIKAPVTKNEVLVGSLELTNLLKGPNDFIKVTDSLGRATVYRYKSDSWVKFDVIPGRSVSVQVVTKSVDMQSKFLLHVMYSTVKVGPTSFMKTGGVMNFVDLENIRGKSVNFPNSVTVQGTEPISLSSATSRIRYDLDYFMHVYVIDGDFQNQTGIGRFSDFVGSAPFVTTSNKVTIFTFQPETYDSVAAVLNPISEASEFHDLTAEASVDDEVDRVKLTPKNGEKQAVEVLTVQNHQIVITSLVFNGDIPPNCLAQVVSGPPNNSSHVLLDLAKSRDIMPYTFNMKYFTIIAQNCSFSLTITSPAMD